MVILITVAVIAIFIFWAVGAYNRMVKLKECISGKISFGNPLGSAS
jgi:hypothetical protein